MNFWTPMTEGASLYSIGGALWLSVLNRLEIHAIGNDGQTVFIDRAQLRGRSLVRNFLLHEELMKGGKLVFNMRNMPNYSRGIEKEAKPFSMGVEPTVRH